MTSEEPSWLPKLYQNTVSRRALTGRRAQVAGRIGEGLALLRGAPEGPGNGLFRQTNEMYHLTGIEVPHAWLTISGSSRQSVLYLPHRDAEIERVTGALLHADIPDLVRQLTGVDDVRPLERLGHDLASFVLKHAVPELWVPHRPAELGTQSRDDLGSAVAAAMMDPLPAPPTTAAALLRWLGDAFPEATRRDLSPVLDSLREIKDSDEIALLRRAGRLCADGITEAMRSTAVGVFEYQLGAVARFVFDAGGARGEGYRGIVAGGRNAWYGHYGRQADQLLDGDLVLMDYAPDVAYYTSDIGRMWPVNGCFDSEQRVLYSFIVEYHRALLRRIRPGEVPWDIVDAVAVEMEEVWRTTDFGTEAHRGAARSALQFRGHLSHPVGMSVHDVGEYRDHPLRPGMVLSVDPMFWIEPEQQYIRCEDTILVTDDGCEVLTGAAPLDCDEIEAVMKQPGLLRTWAGIR